MSALTLALPEDPADRVAALEVLAALGHLRHPHLVIGTLELLSAQSVRADEPDPPGPSLPDLLMGRRLGAGQVVTVGVPLAQALDAAAALGVHHGAIDLAAVVVDPQGRPLLTGIGLAQLAGAHPSGADDVHALARMLAGLLDPDAGSPGAAVSAALASSLSGHPLTRPTPAVLAQQLLGATAPVALPATEEPIRPVRTIHPPVRKPPRRRPDLPPRPVLVGAGVGLLLVALVTVLLSRGRPPKAEAVIRPPRGTTPASSPGLSAAPSSAGPSSPGPRSPGPIDWQAQLTALAVARQKAFAQAQPALLHDADAPGSAAAAVDRARVQEWAKAGVYLRGDPAAVQLVAVKDAGLEVAVLSIRERTAAFDIVARSTGAVVGHHRAGSAQSWTVTLVSTAAGWRTAAVSRA